MGQHTPVQKAQKREEKNEELYHILRYVVSHSTILVSHSTIVLQKDVVFARLPEIIFRLKHLKRKYKNKPPETGGFCLCISLYFFYILIFFKRFFWEKYPPPWTKIRGVCFIRATHARRRAAPAERRTKAKATNPK